MSSNNDAAPWTKPLIDYAFDHRRLNILPHLEFSVVHHTTNLEPVLISTLPRGQAPLSRDDFAFSVYYSPSSLLLTSFISRSTDELHALHQFEELCSAYVIGYVEYIESGFHIHLHNAEATTEAMRDILWRSSSPKDSISSSIIGNA